MAISNSTRKVVTGSATRTLGTLGRSIFNSTIGTFADSETMNQIYGAMNKLASSIETLDKTFDNEAVNGRNKGEDLFSLLAGLDIKNSSDFMNKNYEFMKRLMRINRNEKDITLNVIGINANDKSDVIKSEHAIAYSYTEGNNYVEDYVNTLPQNQQIGDETTKLQLESDNHFNYSGIHNDLYAVTQNLYPDDENKGTFSNKWIAENRNSLLYKTKKLFDAKKVNTIISRFHTDPNKRPSLLDNARSKYGLSHGRNLLTRDAEKGYNTSYVGGYDNPYCRVWTHFHKYDRYYKTIRPFSTVDDQENYVGTMTLEEFHQFPQFADSKDTNKETKGKWGWKKDSNNGWKYSVLQDNGKVNITPKYVTGEASNIHTKQCMFSIENLAWRGYDPYSFEQALSWEQRGPLGGRIMWFPPYGIQFQETTTTQWTANTFLGRGEDVYTYTNTVRTGSLSFMMVVDHPSIIDYVTWTNENKNINDTDILRFLAGCGESDGEGIRSAAKPTPLTDEYTQTHEEIEGKIEVEEPITPNEVAEEPTPEEEKPIENVLCFYVFYPNNYSGTYDDPYGGTGEKIDAGSRVEAIPYLLAGEGAQKSGESKLPTSNTFDNDIAINADEGFNGDGYEMEGSGLGTNGGYIIGTSEYANQKTSNGMRFWTGLGTNSHPRSNSQYKGSSKHWYYRIDGRYKVPQSSDEEKIHYYNQTLANASSYKDQSTLGLNYSIQQLIKNFSDQITPYDGDETDNLFFHLIDMPSSQVFTLAEVAKVLYEEKNKPIKDHCGGSHSGERIAKLKEMLSSERITEIKSVKAVGYASAHGYVDLNIELGKNRAKTAANWFVKTLDIPKTPEVTYEMAGKDKIGNKDSSDTQTNEYLISGDEGSKNAKCWRYAKVIVEFTSKATTAVTDQTLALNTLGKTTDTETTDATNVYAASVEQTETENKETPQLPKKTYVGYNPTNTKGIYNGQECDIFEDTKTKKKWYKVSEDGTNVKYVSVEYANEETNKPKARYGGGSTDENRLRYDQEYHFFKVLKETDPVVYGSLMDKLQYFDPAFHSMTPEGFNGRLTFLQQCMRQGNTVSASDGKFAKGANNLAFGRAPYCVLRLGDFYNQMIVIDNLSISYDPLVWDLNTEGIGVQPLIANVQISFKFIGGGDLTGPVRRLQNAMSFNYYANARLYDNRADRVERMWSDKTGGAIEHDEIINNDEWKYETGAEKKNTYAGADENGNGGRSSSFYTTKMYK